MANKLTLRICGDDYTFIAEESPSYMQKVAANVDERINRIIDTFHCSKNDATILTAINLVDELNKNHDINEKLRKQIKTYLDEASQAKNEAAELKRQLNRLQKQTDTNNG